MRKFLVTIEGIQYEVGVEEIGATESVTPVVTDIKPVAQPSKVSAPAPQKQATAVTNGTPLNAPMPGMVKAYKVSEGAKVKEGDVIIVLEAMKMDNDLTAPCDGVVSFKAQVGSNVDTGDVLCVIG